MKNQSGKDGFTLIELSIVIVVIGLIVGGVVAGGSLIRSSEVNSINSELESFKSAVDLFNKKYNALPGDMFNAQNYWGAAANCTSIQTTVATCNGDGDGSVEALTPSGSVGNEVMLFWKHLANAELIKGNFTGIKAAAAATSASSDNVPSGKLSGSLWAISYLGRNPMDGFSFNGDYYHTFEYGRYKDNSSPKNPVLTTNEMYALDSKFDDGKPGTGSLRTEINQGGTTVQCALNSGALPLPANNFTATYNLTISGNLCVLNFPNAF